MLRLELIVFQILKDAINLLLRGIKAVRNLCSSRQVYINIILGDLKLNMMKRNAYMSQVVLLISLSMC